MIFFPHPFTGYARSPFLLLPAELRVKIWRHLFWDSRVVIEDDCHDSSLSNNRSQLLLTCRFTYLDAFTQLWSHTTVKYINRGPAPGPRKSSEIFATSSAARKLIPCFELEFVPFNWYGDCDLRGLGYFSSLKELVVGPMRVRAVPRVRRNARIHGSDEDLLQDVYQGKPFFLGLDICDVCQSKDWGYRVLIHITFFEGRRVNRVLRDITFDWDESMASRKMRDER